MWSWVLEVWGCLACLKDTLTPQCDSWACIRGHVPMLSELGQGRSVPACHSETAAKTQPHTEVTVAHDVIPLKSNKSPRLTFPDASSQNCLRPFQLHPTWEEWQRWGRMKRHHRFNQLWLNYLTFANFTKTHNLLNTLIRPLPSPWKACVQGRKRELHSFIHKPVPGPQVCGRYLEPCWPASTQNWQFRRVKKKSTSHSCIYTYCCVSLESFAVNSFPDGRNGEGKDPGLDLCLVTVDFGFKEQQRSQCC